MIGMGPCTTCGNVLTYSQMKCLKAITSGTAFQRSLSIHGSTSAASQGGSHAKDALDIGDQVVPSRGSTSTEKWNSLRDISKLSRYHRMKLFGQIVPPNMFKWQSEKWALRSRYAEYGQASGVDPGMLWPNKEELSEMAAVDDELNPDFFRTRTAVLAAKEEKAALRQQKMDVVTENLKKYKKAVAVHKAKLDERRRHVEEIQMKKDQQVKEIQEFLGYAVDPADPRFQAMLARKEAEERKNRKMAIKQAQNQKLIAQLTESTMAIKDSQR